MFNSIEGKDKCAHVGMATNDYEKKRQRESRREKKQPKTTLSHHHHGYEALKLSVER